MAQKETSKKKPDHQAMRIEFLAALRTIEKLAKLAEVRIDESLSFDDVRSNIMEHLDEPLLLELRKFCKASAELRAQGWLRPYVNRTTRSDPPIVHLGAWIMKNAPTELSDALLRIEIASGAACEVQEWLRETCDVVVREAQRIKNARSRKPAPKAPTKKPSPKK